MNYNYCIMNYNKNDEDYRIITNVLCIRYLHYSKLC